MQKRKMGKTEEWVSLLGFGCMRFPKKDGKNDMTQVHDMIDYAKAQGVNYFDTAYVYDGGESERALGEALCKYPRNSFFIADKLPLWEVKEQADLDKLLNTSLQRLETDYIDFYLMHGINKGLIDVIKKYDIVEFFKKKRAEGKIKYIGFSFHDTPEVFREVADLFDWDFVQIQLNYLDWELQRANELYDIITEKNLPCVVMEPIRGGALANPQKAVADIFKKANPNRSASAWALDFCASHPAVKVILSGMSNMAQVEDNVQTLTNFAPMTPEEYKTIDAAVAWINSQPNIGCTGCHYCMPCPKGVKIPNCFSAYNDYMKTGDKNFLTYKFNVELKEAGPDICVKCGACVKKCPQHLDVPKELEKVAELRKEL